MVFHLLSVSCQKCDCWDCNCFWKCHVYYACIVSVPPSVWDSSCNVVTVFYDDLEYSGLSGVSSTFPWYIARIEFAHNNFYLFARSIISFQIGLYLCIVALSAMYNSITIRSSIRPAWYWRALSAALVIRECLISRCVSKATPSGPPYRNLEYIPEFFLLIPEDLQ